MEGSALSDKAFPDFAKKVVLFCHVTSQIKEDKDQDLLQKKGGTGFPYLAWLNEKGDVIAKQAARSVDGMEKMGKTVAAYVDLKKKADGGDASVKTDLFFARIDLGQLKLAEAKAEAEKVGDLSKENKARLEKAYVNLEIGEAAATLRQKEQAVERGKEWAGWLKEGKIPTETAAIFTFYNVITFYAEDAKDAALFEQALKVLTEAFGKDANYKRFLDGKATQLKKLQDSK